MACSPHQQSSSRGPQFSGSVEWVRGSPFMRGVVVGNFGGSLCAGPLLDAGNAAVTKCSPILSGLPFYRGKQTRS